MATQRFYNATDKLVNAFIMGKVNHGDSCSCAVGNLCDGNNQWIRLTKYQRDINPELVETGEAVIIHTGYDAPAIFDIERKFEGRQNNLFLTHSSGRTCFLDSENDPDGFKGLCNVFDYLVTIEDWQEEEKGANIFELLESLN